MIIGKSAVIAYVLKRYPRFSETFVLNEILEQERAGLNIRIFSLLASEETNFQPALAAVQAPVRYLTASGLTPELFWEAAGRAAVQINDFWPLLAHGKGQSVQHVYQALLLAYQIRICGITHVHAHFANDATSVARLASLFAGVPYSFTAHAKDIFHRSVRAEDMRLKMKDAGAVITISDFNVLYLKSLYGGDPGNLHRIYNGIETELLEYESPHNRLPRILAVGRLVEKKGFGYLIEASSILKQSNIPFECRIIGGGEQEEYLRAEIERLQLSKHIRLCGPLSRDQIIEEMRLASVLVAPCVEASDGNRDGLPTVILEAMAVGTPCISTDVTGIPEVVLSEKTGLLVAQRDAEALSNACSRLLQDPFLRVRLASAARRFIEHNCNLRKNCAKIRSLFSPPVVDHLSQPVESVVHSTVVKMETI